MQISCLNLGQEADGFSCMKFSYNCRWHHDSLKIGNATNEAIDPLSSSFFQIKLHQSEIRAKRDTLVTVNLYKLTGDILAC